MHIIPGEIQSKSFEKNADTMLTLSNIVFLRKEKLYTKLKYSRSPAYDIVSGGSAALLAGFIGFLISEKYGFEMVDSGDFYYFAMYCVIFSFSLRPLLSTFQWSISANSFTSLRTLFRFCKVVFLIIKQKLFR